MRVTKEVLEAWEKAAEDPQHKEIIRLAGVGLWAEEYSVAISASLKYAAEVLPAHKISSFEKALDSFPNKQKRYGVKGTS